MPGVTDDYRMDDLPYKKVFVSPEPSCSDPHRHVYCGVRCALATREAGFARPIGVRARPSIREETGSGRLLAVSEH